MIRLPTKACPFQLGSQIAVVSPSAATHPGSAQEVLLTHDAPRRLLVPSFGSACINHALFQPPGAAPHVASLCEGQ